MTGTHRFLVAVLLVPGVIVIGGCGDASGPTAPASGTLVNAPSSGTLVIKVSTDSAHISVDHGSYTLVIDGDGGRSVGANETVTIGGLPTGWHLARLDGVAPNYIIDGPNPRSVYVGTDREPSLPVSFAVLRLIPPTAACLGCWDY